MKTRIVWMTLIGVMTLSLAQTAFGLPSAPPNFYQASQACGCHGALLEQWSKSMHAKALSDPLYRYKVDEADKATNGALGAFCDGCHGPVATMTGQAQDLSRASASSKEGITCDFCHSVTGGSQPPANVSLTVAQDRIKRAQFDDALSPAHKTAYSQFHETAEFCGNCHNVDHPVNGMHLESTYTEWKNGPYAAQGIVCQDCHMTPGPGVTKPNAGTAAAGGPQRQHIFDMTFAGGNVALGDSELAEERLKAAATLDIQAPEVLAPGSSADVVVTVTNSGAGHNLPTGLTEVRQMWLEVKAVAEDGTVTDLGTHEFGSVLKDAAGNSPVELWDAVAFEKDDRIPPQGSSSDTYRFEMPEGGPVEIRAALYYRSCSEEMAAKAGVDIPTTTMVEFAQPVYASEKQRADAMKGDGPGVPPGILALIALGVLVGTASAVAVTRRKKRAM